MGLDIKVGVNNHEEVFSKEYNSFTSHHNLSRTFCNFMSRKDVLIGEDYIPELEQIGKLTGIDISPLYDMENYPDQEYERMMLDITQNEEERIVLINRFKEQKEKLENNIGKAIFTISSLIDELSKIDNILKSLDKTDFDTFDLGREKYFSDFNKDTGDGYIGNNLGQDLRNFKRFLVYAKEHGATTVYFSYG